MKQIATHHERSLYGLDSEQTWSTERAYEHLRKTGFADTKRTAERRLQSCNLLPPEMNEDRLTDELGFRPNRLVLDWAIQQARKRRERVLFAQLCPLPNGKPCLHVNDARGARFWTPVAVEDTEHLQNAVLDLQQHLGKAIALFPHGALLGHLRGMTANPQIRIFLEAYRPLLELSRGTDSSSAVRAASSPHLNRLEAESIHIIREAVSEARNPVMLFSIGKDSCVMLHLARKAFHPSPPPFPLLHVDTRWKFQEMYQFRDFIARDSGMTLLVHVNPEAIAKDINPFDHGSALHTDITKTEGLKQALDHHRFDLVFGGARRDEEKSRAKERVFSFRTATHQWDPKRQRPELWNLYNTRTNPGESIRVFPLSNWTEFDIWHYIHQERIPVVPLYFAKPRPVVARADMIMLVDDERCRMLPGEDIEIRNVRFRSLGCYPLTGAIESGAETIDDILVELANSRQSERQGRKIDTDGNSSMEKKKQEGYF